MREIYYFNSQSMEQTADFKNEINLKDTLLKIRSVVLNIGRMVIVIMV